MHSFRSAASAASFVIATLVLALVGVTAPASAAGPTAVYDSIPASPAPNYPSQPFQAQATREFGDDLILGSGGRVLTSVTIGASTWAREADIDNYADPDAWRADPSGWSHPFTVRVYAVTGPVTAPMVGAVLAETTQVQHVPWRHPDTTGCGTGRWSPISDSDTTSCFSGQFVPLTFDLSTPAVELPSRVAVTLSFNTQTYGAAPLGANGPYNSFNVALPAAAPTKGANSSADTVLWDSTFSGRPAGLAWDSGWTGYVPAIRVTTSGATESTTVVTAANAHGWAFVDDQGAGGTLGSYVAGPAVPPLGHGSARLMLSSAAQGQDLVQLPSGSGTRLDAINELSYSTYRGTADAGGNLAIALQFNLDFDLTDASVGWQGRLVYEPYYTHGGAVVQGAWQTWDALAGRLWASSLSPSATCGRANPCNLAQFLNLYPNAGIRNDVLGGFVLKAGSGWATFDGNVDAVRVGIGGATTQYDFEDTPQCTTECFVSPSGNDLNGGTSFADAKKTIQAAINTVQPGGTVHVDDGTYAESPNVTKSLTLVSENGPTVTTIDLQTGPTYLGSLTIAGEDVTVDGFTIEGFDGSASTTAASNVTVLPNLGKVVITDNVIQVGQVGAGSNDDDGIGVLTYYDVNTADDTTSLTLTGNRFEPLNGTGTRAFYVNPGTNAFLAEDNVIDGDFQFSAVTQAKDGIVRGNTVTGSGSSASLGTWGYPNANLYGHTEFVANTISGTASGFRIRGTNDVTIHHNLVNAVTDGVTVVDTPADGLTAQLDGATVVIRDNSFTGVSGKRVTNSYPNAVNASANWWGTKAVAASDVTGLVDYTPVLTSDSDTSGTAGFQGSVAHLKVHALGAQVGTEGRIQEGIDTTVIDGVVDVAPGAYSERATNRVMYGVHTFGLFFPEAKPGVTIRGVTAADVAIEDNAATQATITTNATNNFGYSGIFVAGDRVTIQGLQIGSNAAGSNKTIEVQGDAFSFLDSYLNDVANPSKGAIYIGDGAFDAGAQLSSIATFTIDDSRFAPGNQVTIANGTGYGHPAAGRAITDNTFESGAPGPFISFRGAAGPGGTPWYTYSVGGAFIERNTFGPADINIRATDAYDEDQFDWAAWRDDNDFARLVWVEDGSHAGELRTFGYTSTSSGYQFVNARQLGGRIDERSVTDRPAGVQIAQAGDTIHVHSGTYPEQAIVDTHDITVQGYGATTPLVDDGATATGNGIVISGSDVTLANVKVQRYATGVRLAGTSGGARIFDVESVDNASHGLFVDVDAALADIVIDGGVYSRNSNVGSGAGRGIVVWDAQKADIRITNVTASDNALVGIDINDGSVTGLTITDNTVVGNADAGIGVLGAQGPGANLIANNTVTDNGRYGIEIKNPNGSGAASGPGSIVVSGNHVTRTAGGTPANKDFAGIAVFRRSVDPSFNTNLPTGVRVIGNEVSGYRYTGPGTHDGFGIVVEGTNHTVTQNIVTNNDVGVQVQAGNTDGLPGDSQPGSAPADYFDRGNAASYSGTVVGNSIAGNTTNFRAVGLSGAADASGNWWGTIDQAEVAAHIAGTVDFTPYFHTGADTSGAAGFQGDHSSFDVVRIGAQVGGGPRIQEAIDMVIGSTVYVHAGDYVEDVVADVADLELLGARHGVAVGSRTFGAATEATIHGQLRITAADVTVDGFSLTHGTTSSSVVGILVTGTGHRATVVRDILDGVSTNHASGVAQAIYLEHGPDGVAITGNAITNVTSQRSAKGIYIGDTSATDPSEDVSITGNAISGITSTLAGAYGIQTNNGAGAGLAISGNAISGLAGNWVHGIGVEGDAPSLSIHHNVISGLTAAGIDKVAVFFEDDDQADAATVERNSLDVGPAAFGVAADVLSVTTPIDATCNWWGSASGPGATAAGTGSLVGPGVDGNPWLVSANLDGACDGLVETVAPTTPLTFAEGTAATNGGTFDNPTTTFTSDATLGTFADEGNGSWSWTLLANDVANDGPRSGTITVTATTTLGATATTSFGYGITNVAPSGTFVAPSQVAVGDAFDIGIDPTVEPSAGDVLAYTFKCGSTAPVVGGASSATCPAPTSAQVGTNIHVAARVADDDGGVSALYEADVHVVAALTITPTPQPFGSVVVGQSSAPVTFTLTNNSDVDYAIDEVGFFVTATNHFRIVGGSADGCSGITLAAHDSCEFDVVFTPQGTGPWATVLGVELDGVQAPLPKPGAQLTGTGVAVPQPVMTVTPSDDPFGFGDVAVDDTESQQFAITNTGQPGSVLHITSIVVTYPADDFSAVVGSLPVDLHVGDAPFLFSVAFGPQGPGLHRATLAINAGGLGYTWIDLEGTGIAPALSVTPSTHNFGDVTVDHAKTRLFTVANTGTAGLTNLDVAIAGDDLTIVAGDSTCTGNSTLDAGASCTVTVRYQPDEVGDDTGTLTATAAGGLSDASSLVGSGVAGEPIVTVTPDEHGFDPIVVGGTPGLQDFTVRNTGDATLTGLDIEITGAAAFTVVSGAGTDCESEATSLAPDATCVVWVQFAPGAGGDKSATLKVLSDNAGNGTVHVPLTGTALAPKLTIAPSGYNFGDVTVDHSKSRTFTVTNTGTAGLTNLDVAIAGDDLSIVADDSDCDETSALGAGEDCEVRVRYSPDEVGDDTGTLTASAAGGLTETANLRGSGVPAKGVITVTPDEGAFGSIETGTSTVLDFSVQNTGDASLTFSSVGLTGSSTFAIEASDDTDCLTEDATLAPGDTCVVRVRFAPGGVGDRSGTLKIQSNAANATVNVPLDGTATPRPSDVSVTPNPYDFGHIVFRGTKTRTFTVTNSGGTPVTITSVTRTGSSTFTVLAADDECAGETLGTGEGCTFRVRFQAPASTAGSKSATIHVAGSGFDEIEVAVTATAEAFKAKVDAFVTDKTDRPSNYVGVGVYCTSSCSRQQASESVRRGATYTYRVRIRNNGNGVDNIRVRLYQTGSKASIRRIQVLRNGNQDVTSSVTNGSYVARDMNPGAEIYFWVKVTVHPSAVRGRVNYVQISGQSTRKTSVKDVVRAKTTVR